MDWKEQLKNRISSVEALSQYVHLTPEEIEGIEKASSRFRWAVTPYYASLMARDDPNCPIRRQAIPSPLELYDVAGVPESGATYPEDNTTGLGMGSSAFARATGRTSAASMLSATRCFIRASPRRPAQQHERQPVANGAHRGGSGGLKILLRLG